uniref:RING-type domain-containing protein n=1 Tax=viral metagenome TaxID=1070528 RepID=A0A6C0IIK0_9ZZZZ
MNAAYDYYLGLHTTYLKLYLSSLNMQILRAVGYKHNILFTKQSHHISHNPCKKFIRKMVMCYSQVSNEMHIELINSIPNSKMIINAESIHQFLLRNNIHTRWTPSTISTILLSTRLLHIQLNIDKNIQLKNYDDCSICLEPIEPVKCCKLTCSHYFCSTCVFHYIEQLHTSHNPYILCPLCRSDVTNITISENHYDDCVNHIKKIKNIRIACTIDDFEGDIEQITNWFIDHPNAERMKSAFFVTVRIYFLFVYFEYILAAIGHLLKTASSSRNPDRL